MKITLPPSVRFPGLLSCAFLTLLFVVAMPGCKRGAPSNAYQQEEENKDEAMNRLREQGATITPKTYPMIGNGYAVELKSAQIDDQTFQSLKTLKRVTELDLSKSSLADEQMEQLNDIAYLIGRLNLSDTAVTDAGLAKLTNLERCMFLNLTGTKVTPKAAKRFEQEHSKPQNLGRMKLPPLKVRI
jgi:hypothetical protein